MKKTIIDILYRPKIIIPITLAIAIVIGLVSYRYVGQPPIVNILSDTNNQNLGEKNQKNSIDLAFLRAGRLSTVSVNVGDAVKKGDVLASLDASDVLGTLNQTKGALELAKAQYSSLDIQYSNAKKQQDVLVVNAYRTLLSNNLSVIARNKYDNTWSIDESQTPQISGTYTCDKQGSYEILPYASMPPSGYSFDFTGIESGTENVTSYTAQALGSCGLFIQFPVGYYSSSVKWILDIPNPRSSSYATNKNAYDLAVSTRDQVLGQFEANLGKDGSSKSNIAQAAIDSAKGAYESALATYNNTIIVAPNDGMVSFIDSHLKIGQSITANKTLITIIKK